MSTFYSVHVERHTFPSEVIAWHSREEAIRAWIEVAVNKIEPASGHYYPATEEAALECQYDLLYSFRTFETLQELREFGESYERDRSHDWAAVCGAIESLIREETHQ